MKRISFPVLFISIFFLTAMVSCKKDPVAINNDHKTIDTSHHTVQTQQTEVDATIYLWTPLSNGSFYATLFGITTQLNTADNNSLKVFLVTDGIEISIDKPITYGNGMLVAKIQSPDVIVNYQGFNTIVAPPPSIRIKVVAQ